MLGERRGEAAGGGECLLLALGEGRVVLRRLVQAFHERAQHAQARLGVGVRSGLDRLRPGGHGREVSLDRLGERLGRGEEALLEQHDDEVGGGRARVSGLPPRGVVPTGRVLGQQAMCLALGGGVIDFKGFGHADREGGSPVPPRRQLALHPADHDAPELLLVRLDVAHEAVTVEHLEQRGERFQVAVVRGRREEKPVFAVRRQGTDRLGAERVGRVLAARLRGARVHLVHDEQIEGARVLGHRGEDLAEQPHRAVPLEPVHADDQQRVVRPWVGVQAAGPAQLLEQGGVDDAEVEAELVAHLVPPLQREAGRADDQHRPGPVPQRQLLHHEAGFHGLPQANVVGDEQVRAWHGESPDHRVELVVGDAHARPERRLEHGLVGGGDRAPAHRVEEGVELAGVIEPVGGVGEGVLVVGDRAPLQLPDHAELLVAGVILDADQGDDVGRAAGDGSGLRGKAARRDAGDDPDPVADGDKLSFGRGAT